jgi:hypothetical protein
MSHATIGEDSEWVILYHGPCDFKGRAEFLRIMLEDKGVPYSNFGKDLVGPTGRMDAFRGSPEAVTAKSDLLYPTFFPPAIWHRPKDAEEVVVNQVAACMVYIGEQLGYAPRSAAERARADAITQNALDYISGGRTSFHPVKYSAPYSEQKEEADRTSAEWAQGRMRVSLQFFEKVLRTNANPTVPVAGGENVTYADFSLFHVSDATIAQFNNDKYGFAWDRTEIPACKEFYANFALRPNIAAYMASGRRPPYAGDSMM